MSTPTTDALYVYALAAPGLPRRLTIRRNSLRVIAVDGIDAVVQSGSAAPPATAGSLREQHAIIADLADRIEAILPARFGSVVPDGALRDLMTAHHAEITAALDHVRGCVQMTVRVFGEPEPWQRGTSVPTGTAFLEQRRRRAHHQPPEVAIIHEVLSDRVKDQRFEAGERGLRVTVFHLVQRARVEKYRAGAAALPSKVAPHSVTITGPWAPFAFAPQLF